MTKNFKTLLPLLVIFSFSCAAETVTEEVDPALRGTNFTLTSPENRQLFSIAVTEIPFAFSYTREATDFSDYNFTLNLCRDEELMTDCIPEPVQVTMSDEDESGILLPTVTNFRPIFPACLFILFVLCMWLFPGREKHSQLASASMLTLFALFVLGGVLGCTETVTEQVARDASPELTAKSTTPIEISADALGAYYWQVTAVRADDDMAEPQTSQVGTFSIGVMSTTLTAVTLNVGDNVGAPIRVAGITIVSLEGCSDFTLNTATGQVTVAAVPTMGIS